MPEDFIVTDCATLLKTSALSHDDLFSIEDNSVSSKQCTAMAALMQISHELVEDNIASYDPNQLWTRKNNATLHVVEVSSNCISKPKNEEKVSSNETSMELVEGHREPLNHKPQLKRKNSTLESCYGDIILSSVS
jgi:hypothetical protein